MRTTKRADAQPNFNTAAQLRSYAERIVRLEDEKTALNADIKEVLNEAASNGYDKKALRVVVARMREDEVQRSLRLETEALSEVYLAGLGMLAGLPLGDSARLRFETPAREPSDQHDIEDFEDRAESAAPVEPPAGAMSQETVDEARAKGGEAAAGGERIFANPYVAGDPRRAAWDEGWCAQAGSDGMDLPAAFRRKPKKSPDDEANPDTGN